jgi:peptidoglycan/LPS O-acetylase OafA/YrhL
MRRHQGGDAIRGLAILLVIFHHVGWRFPNSVSDPIGKLIFSSGWGGVDIFFAISGFLITRILLDSTSSEHIRHFFIKRAYRILPIFLIAIALYAVLSLIAVHEVHLLQKLWIPVLFLTGWVIPFMGLDAVPYTITWSLSVEETAYVVLGLSAIFGSKALVKMLHVVMLGAFCIRIYMIYYADFSPELIYYFTPGRVDAIAAGGLFAVYANKIPSYIRTLHWSVSMSATLFFIALIAFVGQGNPLAGTFGYSAVAIAAAWFVSSVFQMQPVADSWVVRIASSIGLVSYFIYLFHVFTIAAVHAIWSRMGAPPFNIYILVTVVVLLTYLPARMSWRYFEKPIIDYCSYKLKTKKLQ